MDQKITDYINKQKSPQKEICHKLRSIILKTLSNAGEEMKWGVPAFVGGKLYIVALKDHVNFGYNDGSKKMKHVEIKSLDQIDSKKIIELIKSTKK
ncbi:MAG: DUF1801 domain-containing protein [Patescibacteria group bacterium]|nr:DUF1801 domain-containing protein [Patescibacteria group bacterium]